MVNADEHEKLLAQIAELGKDSTNFFDVEKEFFLIDSNNLGEVRTRFYGYSIQRSGIYEQDNLTAAAVANLDGRGCYVYVEAKDGQITIKQDLNGCWGLYLFRQGDYFAISNSFFRLLDHVKFRYPLTVNRDYCHYLRIEALCSNAYSETAVNEIQLLDRSAIVHIDIAKKSLRVELINYKEHSIPLDSAEGIATLDRWVEFWATVFRGLAKHTEFIQADLTGGFDSRVCFLLLLHSGIDLGNARIYSINNDLHTHKEDYEIASKIVAHYGFKLNSSFPDRQSLRYSLTDIFNINQYGLQTFTNIPALFAQKSVEKMYWINGGGGETIRRNWSKFGTLKKYIDDRIQRTNTYSRTLSQELANSTKVILNAAFRNIGNRYKITGKEDTLLQYLCQETQCRNHFGKGALNSWFQNTLSLSPVLDPTLRTLQLNASECSDLNLLTALLFVRYNPTLLQFPFNGNSTFDEKTLAFAKKLDKRFPRRETSYKASGEEFHLQPQDLYTKKILDSNHNNPNIPGNLPQACLKAQFDSSKTYGVFTSYFDEELYQFAAYYYETNIFARERPLNWLIGVTKVLEDVEISKRNRPLYNDLKYFLTEDFCNINRNAQIIYRFRDYISARIDVKLISKAGDFQIISLSDNKTNVSKPDWYQKNGIGYILTSYVGKLSFVAKSETAGRIRLILRGLDKRNPSDSSKFIPYWIDYTKLIVNGKTLFDKLTPIWHDKFYRYDMTVKAGEEVTVQVEWLPHRSDT